MNFFVTAIDTNVGKTVVSALLCRALDYSYWKPIQCGDLEFSDTMKVKKWVPELRKVPKKFIHKPWEINDENILMLNKDYPSPVVKHEEARLRALAAFKKI